MRPREERTLNLLKSKPEGVTCWDFQSGTDYRASIRELRDMGYKIIRIEEQDERINRRIGRWFYRGKGQPLDKKPNDEIKSKRNKAIKLALEVMSLSKDRELKFLASRFYNILK